MCVCVCVCVDLQDLKPKCWIEETLNTTHGDAWLIFWLQSIDSLQNHLKLICTALLNYVINILIWKRAKQQNYNKYSMTKMSNIAVSKESQWE